MTKFHRCHFLILAPLALVGCAQSQSAPAPETVVAATAPDTKPAATAASAGARPVALQFTGQMGPGVKISAVGLGWAKTSVNAVVFRASSIVTWKDTQFISYYDGDGNVVLGKRKVGSNQWETKVTPFKGNVKDAHNAISIGVDGSGVVHLSWDMHNNKLRYAHGTAPGSLELSAEMPMTGIDENSVTYPQFSSLPNGDLLFAYREGSSGNGNMMLNRYDVKTAKWSVVQHPLIVGGGKRNPYTNPLAIDSKGGIHLSWCWRDTPDVATNHDICYAYSPDQGKTWQKSTGETYKLPVTIDSAEVAFPVAQKSDLINQTSMTTDAQNRPLIVSYWRSPGTPVPQFQLVWHDGKKWHNSQVGKRTTPFQLGGSGTKRIPISRPHVVAGNKNEIYVVFRDEERASDVSVAISKDAEHAKWETVDLYQEPIRGQFGIGTWGTQAEFKDIRVTKGQKTLFSNSSAKDMTGWTTQGGQWKISGGTLQQTGDGENVRAVMGDINGSDYTLSLKARKTGGKEGFLIIFGSPDNQSKNWWNLGGWGNTKNALEISGAPSEQVAGHIDTGRWYDIRVELKGARVNCYLDGKLIQTAARTSAWEPSYDPEMWKSQRKLHLFWEKVGQGDGEALENIAPQPVGVLEWSPTASAR